MEKHEAWPALLDWAQRWTQAEPENALAWYVLGRAYGELKRYPEAIAAYRQDLRLSPEDAFAHNNLGNAYRNSRRHLDSLQAYRAALRIKPGYIQAWQNFAAAYYELKGVAGVSLALGQLHASDPELAEAWRKLAVEYVQSRDARVADEAIKVLRGLDEGQRERMFEILLASVGTSWSQANTRFP